MKNQKAGENFCWSKFYKKPKRVSSRQLADRIKYRHEKIIKKLLKDFDIEATKKKYEEMSVCVIKLDNRKESFNITLRNLMGSDVIRFNDRKWDEKLGRRIEEEYEKAAILKEERLAKAELERIDRLKRQGLEALSVEEERQKKLANRTEDLSKRSLSEKSSRGLQPQEGFNIPPHHSALVMPVKDEEVENVVDSVETKDGDGSTRSSSAKSREEHRSPTPEDDSPKPSFRYRSIPPQWINELYEEETIDGLYNLAASKVVIGLNKKKEVVKEEYPDVPNNRRQSTKMKY